MHSLRRNLMGSTALSLALGLGLALSAAGGAAACGPCDPCAPMAAAACGPCDPCAPMAAAGCGPCDPCAPAAAAGTECFVPRLQDAAAEGCGPCDPCAAMAAACGPCDPCAPMAAAAEPNVGNPAELDTEAVRSLQEALNRAGHDAGPVDGIWGPRTEGALTALQQDHGVEAAGKIDARSLEALGLAGLVMAAAACGACGPMAAAGDPSAAHDPCAAMAAACDPSAPMAAACEPGAPMAAACDPCAPMVAAACDPCAPAMACGPCDPCRPCAAAAPPPEMSDEELTELYDCLLDHMRSAYGDEWIETGPGFAAGQIQHLHLAAYGDSGLDEAESFVDWPNAARVPYESGTHGGRLVTNHVNPEGEEAYREYEDIDAMPVGGTAAKPSFTISPQGEALLGPLFLMEKMEAGWNADSADWRYTSVMPDGTIAVRTLDVNDEQAATCAQCHMAMGGDQDSLLFLPEEYRAQ
jgi:hypothetical protein